MPVIKHDLDSLQHDLYFVRMPKTKKRLVKMVFPAALVESQPLASLMAVETGSQREYAARVQRNNLEKLLHGGQCYIASDEENVWADWSFKDVRMRRDFSLRKRGKLVRQPLTSASC